MREFFHGWRRKVGCVTLVMALALNGAWIRSHVVYDNVTFVMGGQQQMIHLQRGEIIWWWWNLNGAPQKRGRVNIAHAHGEDGIPDLWRNAASLAIDGQMIQGTSIPCLPFSFPLTLLSAYLLLWKPRKRTEPDHA